MKSVKRKLFLGFSSIIFLILIFLSYSAIKLFSFNQEKEIFNQVDSSLDEIIFYVKKNSDKKNSNY